MRPAADLHAAVNWRSTLARLGIDESALSGRHTACPNCGGTDRFRFDDYRGRGGFFCSGCGPGDGFDLLQRVHGWNFAETRRAVADAAGHVEVRPQPAARTATGRPGARVRDILRTSCAVTDCDDAMRYLSGRQLLPLPEGLRAHAGVEYWDDGACVGRYPALVGPVMDIDGELVTAHVTYLQDGAKLQGMVPRKLLGALSGRRGCAVRLGKAEGTLGIAEGIETALAASHVHGVPTWAALSAAVLAKFEPPAGVTKLVIFADRDAAGLEAAWRLRDRLAIDCELQVPKAPAGDWADVRASR